MGLLAPMLGRGTVPAHSVSDNGTGMILPSTARPQRGPGSPLPMLGGQGRS